MQETLQSAAKPKIGIPTPTSIDAAYNLRSWQTYADAVQQAGGDAVRLEIAQPEDGLLSLAGECDGFVLPGSPADVDPGHYNTPRLEACGPADPLRERADFALLEHAQRQHKPLLGICYGCQSMNVFYGGSLIQDLCPLPVNHAAGATVAVAHTVLISSDSLLGSLLLADADAAAELTPSAGGLLRLPVNTSHHQSVATLGSQWSVSARCPDDEVVEAIEPGELFHVEQAAFLLGVQWHPERSTAISAASRAIFRQLVLECETVDNLARTASCYAGRKFYPWIMSDESVRARSCF